MKILVIGGSGVIGFEAIRKFSELGHDVFFTYNQNKIFVPNGLCVDIRDKNLTLKLIKKIKPDIVVHTTAITNVDLCETDKELAKSVNVIGTSNIIEGCKLVNSKLVYISTSFVFDGTKSKYHEDDPTSPATFYGITKENGEKLVSTSGLQFLILRTDQPYCWKENWQHPNSVSRVLETIKSGKVLNEIIDWYNRPTYVPNFVTSMSELIRNNESGIFHVVGSDFINRYEFSLKVAEIFNLNKDLIKPITSETLHLPARRVNVNLENDKLTQKTGVKMLGVKEGLIEMLKSKNQRL
jgi:dTDP-4-dehydrorhamnose reductase